MEICSFPAFQDLITTQVNHLSSKYINDILTDIQQTHSYREVQVPGEVDVLVLGVGVVDGHKVEGHPLPGLLDRGSHPGKVLDGVAHHLGVVRGQVAQVLGVVVLDQLRFKKQNEI